jgi:Xaa-Pro aminopeptidase
MQQFFFDSSIYQERRNQLKKNLKSGKYLFLGNKESGINFRDNWYPFRQDSTFLYYFGVNLPGLCAIVDVDNDEEIIFGDELTIDDIVWTGPLPALHELAGKAGINTVFPVNKLNNYINSETHHLPPYRPEHVIAISQYKGIDAGSVSGTASISFIKAVVAQRSIKSSEEVEQLHIAASHTSEMHHRVMKSAEAGRYEYDLVAQAYKYAWSCHLPMSFTPISTINGHILHNHDYSHQLKSGDMVLFDGGMEAPSGYAGDMTRTFPVDGTFSSIQAEMYDIVHRSFKAAEAAVKPGVKFKDIHLLAARVLVEGLSELGIMKGDPAEAVADGAHTMFFQCGLGHMMGLDVHDMENLGEQYVGYTDTFIKSKEFGLKSLRLGKELHPGYVVTVEPGIYIIPELIDLRRSEGKYLNFINYDELNKYRNFGGIRIENDYLVTESGYELLGDPIPTSREWVEETRRSVLES